MSKVPQVWKVTNVEKEAGKRSSLRTFVEKQLPETRIFVDELYQGFSDSGGRSRIDRLIKDRGKSPWPLAGNGPT